MALMVEQRALRPFRSSEDYLYAMKEDLAEWLNDLYPELETSAEKFWEKLQSGLWLCRHANNVRSYAERYRLWRSGRGESRSRAADRLLASPPVGFFPAAKPGTFFARDNVSNFISWCRNALAIIECLLFETDDLILLKNEKHVVLCLLEIARKGARFGMPAPTLVLLELEIEEQIAAERNAGNGGDEDSGAESDNGAEELPDGASASRQIVTNDLKSLDDMVRVEVQSCSCPTQFPMIRVSEGKYRIGDTKVLIFVRLLRKHVMVRVGGGWDTLAHYLDKHDPCRCRNSHKSSTSAKLCGAKTGGARVEISRAKVLYERKHEVKKEPVGWGTHPAPLSHRSPTH